MDQAPRGLLLQVGEHPKQKPWNGSSLGDVAEVDSNPRKSPVAFDFVWSRPAIVWSGSAVYLRIRSCNLPGRRLDGPGVRAKEGACA